MISRVHRITVDEVLHQPITEYRRKLESAIRILRFEQTGEVKVLTDTGIDDKHDEEYESLKKEGFLNGR